MKFDGTLTEQEQERLKNLSILEMKLIKYYLKKYQNELTGFRDLVGDIEVPSNLFYLNMFLFGHLLENNPKIRSSYGITIRKNTIGPMIQLLLKKH